MAVAREPASHVGRHDPSEMHPRHMALARPTAKASGAMVGSRTQPNRKRRGKKRVRTVEQMTRIGWSQAFMKNDGSFYDEQFTIDERQSARAWTGRSAFSLIRSSSPSEDVNVKTRANWPR